MRRLLSIVFATCLMWTVGFSVAAADGKAFAFNGRSSLNSNLEAAMKAKAPVTLVLNGGHSYSGTITALNNESLVLSKLRGKEYYDAMVRLSAIAAVEARVRK